MSSQTLHTETISIGYYLNWEQFVDITLHNNEGMYWITLDGFVRLPNGERQTMFRLVFDQDALSDVSNSLINVIRAILDRSNAGYTFEVKWTDHDNIPKT